MLTKYKRISTDLLHQLFCRQCQKTGKKTSLFIISVNITNVYFSLLFFQRRCLFLKIWLALTIILGNKQNIVTRIFQRKWWLLLLFFSHLQWQLISNFQTQIIFWWFVWFNTCPIYLFFKTCVYLIPWYYKFSCYLQFPMIRNLQFIK